MTGLSIDGIVAWIEATCPLGERKEQAIATILQSIETNLQSIEGKYSSVEAACTLCDPKWSFGAETFYFSQAKLSSIDTKEYFPRQKVDSIEDGYTFVETRCSIVDEK